MDRAADRRNSGAVLCLVLSAADNVCVLCSDVAAGDAILVGDEPLNALHDAPLGHKLARFPIAAGDRVVKCGVPIGTATRPIVRGEYVHTHNLRSDYLPTFTLEDGERRRGGGP